MIYSYQSLHLSLSFSLSLSVCLSLSLRTYICMHSWIDVQMDGLFYPFTCVCMYILFVYCRVNTLLKEIDEVKEELEKCLGKVISSQCYKLNTQLSIFFGCPTCFLAI